MFHVKHFLILVFLQHLCVSRETFFHTIIAYFDMSKKVLILRTFTDILIAIVDIL